jgi:hypothetical protein
LSPTPTLEDDEEYEHMRHNYEADQNARRRHIGEDLIWHTSISALDNLIFMKHIYVHMNAYVIIVRPRFV